MIDVAILVVLCTAVVAGHFRLSRIEALFADEEPDAIGFEYPIDDDIEGAYVGRSGGRRFEM